MSNNQETTTLHNQLRIPEEVPGWLREIDSTLTVTPQYILSGAIRDVLLTAPDQDGFYQVVPEALQWMMQRNEFDLVLSYDPIDSLRVLSFAGAEQKQQDELLKQLLPEVQFLGQRAHISLEQLGQVITLVTAHQAVQAEAHPRVGLIIDYASRIAVSEQNTPETHALYRLALKRADTATQNWSAQAKTRQGLFNPVIWMVDREQDLPHWLIGSDRVRLVRVPGPELSSRERFIEKIAPSLPMVKALSEDERKKLFRDFAALTDKMSLRSLLDMIQLFRERKTSAAQLPQVVKLYKLGLAENRWQDSLLEERLAQAPTEITKRIKGQDAAVSQALDILIRSNMGLTGAQTGDSSPHRPQGILFFAGPTGVGKTALAKELAKLVFGTAESFHRFDMSEFSSEESQARLIGSPPGYIGHDAGGELTNAVRQNPFSLLLFDEIEKADASILDKFLQILEDGRLTDGTGGTVYFSETLIVFTSNAGIYETGPDGKKQARVTPGGQSYAELQSTVLAGIQEHFVSSMARPRPELLNRIGDNFVIFDFIDETAALQILQLGLGNIAERFLDRHQITLTFSDAVLLELQNRVPATLHFGGRGVNNMLETVLINPLGRALFATPAQDRTVAVEVTGLIADAAGRISVKLEWS